MARHTPDPRLIAALVNHMRRSDLSQRGLAHAAKISPGYLSEILGGKKAPSLQVVTALDRALGARGALIATMPIGVNDEHRDQIAAAVNNPTTVTPDTVEAFQRTLDAQRDLDDTLGSAAMLAPVDAQMSTITTMARHAAGPTRPAFMQVAAQWAQFAGWLHMSVGRWDGSATWLGHALSWAMESGDPDLTATAMSYQAHLAWLQLQAAATAGQSEAALRVAGTYPGQAAYDAFQAARAYASVGDLARADELLREADRLVEAVDGWSGEVPPWQYQRDGYVWRLERGLVLLHMAPRRPECLQGAVSELRAGVADIPQQWRGADWAAEYKVHLATGLMRAGELDEATQLLESAGQIAEATRSPRVTRLVEARDRALWEARGWNTDRP